MRSSPRLTAAALLLAVLIIYWPVRHHGFIPYDDPDYIPGNPHVLAGLSLAGVKWAFTTTRAANYFPLTWLTLMVQAACFGTNAAGYHVVDAAVHAANALLLWRVLARLAGSPDRSAIVALLFAVHPMHVESVAWAAEWKDVLSTFLVLLCIGSYERYVRSPAKVRWYAGVLTTFVLSLLAKPMYVSLPAVLLLLDVWPLNRLARATPTQRARLLGEKLPLVVFAVLAAIATVIAQHRQHAMASTELLPASTRLANVVVAYGAYLQKLALPTGLAVFYPYPPLSAAAVIASGVLLMGISTFVLFVARRQPALAVGWAWFLGTLVPVIGFVQVGAQSMADRYSYFPSIGIFIAVVWGVSDWLERRRVALRLAAMTGLVVIAGYALLARRQVDLWQDTRHLFEHADAVTAENWVADLQLGNLAYDAGDRATAAGYYTDLTRVRPTDARGYNGLGNCLVNLNPNQAVSLYEKAVQHDPGSADFHLNLANALLRTGDRADARAACRRAEQLAPGDPRAIQLAQFLDR